MSQILYREQMEGITIDRIRRDPGYTMPSKHLHYDYEIYFLAEGERYYFIVGICRHTFLVGKAFHYNYIFPV